MTKTEMATAIAYFCGAAATAGHHITHRGDWYMRVWADVLVFVVAFVVKTMLWPAYWFCVLLAQPLPWVNQ